MFSQPPPLFGFGFGDKLASGFGGESSGMDMNDSADAPTQIYDLQHADFQLWRSKQESKRDRKRQRTMTAKAAAAAAGSAGSL